MILSVKNLSIIYKTSRRSEKQLEAVKSVSFRVKAGEKFCLVGESGSGKTSIAIAIPKLLPETAIVNGEVLLNNIDIYQVNSNELIEFRRKHISFIFQDSTGSLIPNITVGKQFSRVAAYRMNISDKEILKHTVKEFLLRVGLMDTERVLNSYPYQLSGGMCQRVMIAMALCVKPSLVIADEPTAALDVLTQQKILDLIIELQNELKFALLFITHDMRIASHYSDFVGVMQDGMLIETNRTNNFFEYPQNIYSQKLVESAKMLSV